MALDALIGLAGGALIGGLTGQWAFWLGIGLAVGLSAGLAVGAGSMNRA